MFMDKGVEPMNRITREHYPVSKLPEELRREFEGFETVTVVGEKEEGKAATSIDDGYHDYDGMMDGIRPMTLKELLADREAHPERYSGNVTAEAAVARVRALRDEWDSDR
jgi:hypothetical protein